MNLLLFTALLWGAANAGPVVHDSTKKITYRGFSRNQVEVFDGIPYAKDTSGANRFKPPRPIDPRPGTVVDATKVGVACPQVLNTAGVPFSVDKIRHVSEDCLNLNIVRPKSRKAGRKLPVLLYIHGGGFWTGFNAESTTLPDGLVEQSVANGLPVIHVAINYRLGFFGFAKAPSLKAAKSENAALRDHRLAIEWVRDNIEAFGGDPHQITISGQSSGGLAVGMQITAYGGSKPVPFQRGICESQALEPGITGKFTEDAMSKVIKKTGCEKSGLASAEAISCLRKLDTMTLLNASIDTYEFSIATNIGDIWLPTVDGDFLPDAPSTLVRSGRIADVDVMIGWTDNDVAIFTDLSIATKQDTSKFISTYLPDLTKPSLKQLLALYPSSQFSPSPISNLTAEFYRSAQIFRDIIMTCMPIWLGENLHRAGNSVYFYEFNQTILTPLNDKLVSKGLGVVHTSEFAYVFGNLTRYLGRDGLPPTHPTESDRQLLKRASRSWSTFASLGHPSEPRKETFKGWGDAFAGDGDTRIFVAGGPSEGLSPIAGPGATSVVKSQFLKQRCGLLNSRKLIDEMRF